LCGLCTVCTNGHRGARGWGLSWGCAIRGRLVAGNIARSQEGLEKGVQTSMAQGQSTKITMIKWIRTSRLSTKNSLSQEGMDFPVAGRLTALAAQRRHCQDAPDRLSERSKVRVQGLGFRVQGDFTGKNLECIVVGLRCGSAALLCTHTHRDRERERERGRERERLMYRRKTNSRQLHRCLHPANGVAASSQPKA